MILQLLIINQQLANFACAHLFIWIINAMTISQYHCHCQLIIHQLFFRYHLFTVHIIDTISFFYTGDCRPTMDVIHKSFVRWINHSSLFLFNASYGHSVVFSVSTNYFINFTSTSINSAQIHYTAELSAYYNQILII